MINFIRTAFFFFGNPVCSEIVFKCSKDQWRHFFCHCGLLLVLTAISSPQVVAAGKWELQFYGTNSLPFFLYFFPSPARKLSCFCDRFGIFSPIGSSFVNIKLCFGSAFH